MESNEIKCLKKFHLIIKVFSQKSPNPDFGHTCGLSNHNSSVILLGVCSWASYLTSLGINVHRYVHGDSNTKNVVVEIKRNKIGDVLTLPGT